MADLKLPWMVQETPQSEPEIGDHVSFEYLVLHGGKFYPMDGKSYCDTPLMTFVLEPETFTLGYRRIE